MENTYAVDNKSRRRLRPSPDAIPDARSCRAGDRRFVEVQFSGPQEPTGRRKYWPIYAVCEEEEYGLPSMSHAFGSYGQPITGAGWPSFYLEEPHRPRHFRELLDQFGDLVDHLLFASDFPHWDADEPDACFPVDLPLDLQQKIYHDNAAKLYRLRS